MGVVGVGVETRSVEAASGQTLPRSENSREGNLVAEGEKGGAKGKLPTTTDWWQRGEGKKLPPNAHNMAFVLGRHKQGGKTTN